MQKIAMPKINFSKINWSKLNLRKFNWMTVLGILSYLYILVLIPYFAGKKSPFVQFHVKQGMALLVIWTLFLFSFYVLLLPWIFGIFISVCLILGIVNVVTGKERPLPLIGKLK